MASRAPAITRGFTGAHPPGLSQDLLNKVGVIEGPERTAEHLPVLGEMISGGLVVENAHDIRCQHHLKASERCDSSARSSWA
jgi:hypothetical protein